MSLTVAAIMPAGSCPKLQAIALLDVSAEIRQAITELARHTKTALSVRPREPRSRALLPHFKEVAQQLTRMEELAHDLLLNQATIRASVPPQGRE